MSLLNNYSEEQLRALDRLYALVRRHWSTGGANAAACLLLGLYNGRRFPFDLTELRRFDPGNLAAALVVLEMDALRTYAEVHVVIAAIKGCPERDISAEFEHWAYDLRLKGRCKKEFLPKRITEAV